MRTDIEEPPGLGCVPSVERTKDATKNEVFRPSFEFVLDPVGIPLLVVHAIEEPRQRRQRLRLTMAARGAT